VHVRAVGRAEGSQEQVVVALLLGRKTYEIFAAYWPGQPAGNPIAARLNGAPKYVASRTLDTVGWANSTLLQGDVAEAVARTATGRRAPYRPLTGRADIVELSLVSRDGAKELLTEHFLSIAIRMANQTN
jgi:dihydrofolate reductase